jgi:hypothetical protein
MHEYVHTSAFLCMLLYASTHAYMCVLQAEARAVLQGAGALRFGAHSVMNKPGWGGQERRDQAKKEERMPVFTPCLCARVCVCACVLSWVWREKAAHVQEEEECAHLMLQPHVHVCCVSCLFVCVCL